MNTAIINVLIEHPSVFFLKLIVEPLAGAVFAYGLVWLAMRPKDGRKVHNPFLWHSCGMTATIIGSAIFRIIAMVTFAGRGAYEPASETGAAGFYVLIIPAIVAAGYIAWLKKKTLLKYKNSAFSAAQDKTSAIATVDTNEGNKIGIWGNRSKTNKVLASRPMDATTSAMADQAIKKEDTMPKADSSGAIAGETDYHLYEIVANELETGNLQKGMWTKVFADAGGDDKSARLKYIQLRVAQLASEAENGTQESTSLAARENLKSELVKMRQEQQKFQQVLANPTEDPKSAHELGRRYYYGIGVTKNLEMAFRLHKVAAAAGIGDSQYSLGVMFEIGMMFENGGGVDQDLKAALDWYMKAAGNNEVNAMKRLAKAFEFGELGLTEDKKMSEAWNARATAKNPLLGELGLTRGYD